MELTKIELDAIQILSMDRMEQSRDFEKYANVLNGMLNKGILYLDGLGRYEVNLDMYEELINF